MSTVPASASASASVGVAAAASAAAISSVPGTMAAASPLPRGSVNAASASSDAWDALLLTASNESQAAAFEAEVAARQQRGSLPPPSRTRVLVVCDPQGQRIGSGGATMAALHALLESLPGESRQQRLSLLKSLKIGMFHSGGDSQRLPTCSVRGKAFCGLPASSSSSAPGVFESTPLDFLIARLASLQRCPGVLISATDCLLDFPHDYPTIEAGSAASRGVLGCTVRTPRKLGSAHGVFVVDAEAERSAGSSDACAILPVANILQKASQSELEQAGAVEKQSQTVLLDAGNIFLCPDAIEALLDLAQQAPFDSCCRAAPDHSGSHATGTGSAATLGALVATNDTRDDKAFRFELYTDVLLPMNPALSRDEYMSSPPPDPSCPPSVLRGAREKMWEALHGFKCFASVHPRASFFHMGTVAERMAFMFDERDEKCLELRRQIGFRRTAHAVFDHPLVEQRSKGAAMLNCFLQSQSGDKEQDEEQTTGSESSDCGSSPDSSLGAGSFVEYSHLRGSFSTGAGSFVSGVRSRQIGEGLGVPAGVCVQETQLREGWAEVLGAPAPSHRSVSSPPTVVSIFHADDPIKTPYTDRRATLMRVPLERFLGRVASLAGRPMQEVVGLVWPAAKEDAQRSLWSARLFPVFYPERHDPLLSMWIMHVRPSDEGAAEASQSKEGGGADYPRGDVVRRWLKAPRASFCDILACADGSAETLWRERLSCAVDVRLLRRHLFHEEASCASPVADAEAEGVVSAVLARAHAAHVLFPSHRSELLRPLFQSLDRWAQSCCSDPVRLDVAARACWLQSSLLRLLFAPAEGPPCDLLTEPEQLAGVIARHPTLGAVQAQLARADLGDWARILPAALESLASVRSSTAELLESSFSSSGAGSKAAADARALMHPLHLLYAQAVAALGRCAVCRPETDLSFAAAPASSAVLPGSTLALQGCVRVDLFGGWSDTPPVCYEQGGCVLNVAVRIDEALPLQLRASVRVVGPQEPLIVAQLSADEADAGARTELNSLAQFEDYADPSSPAALLKCVLLAMGVVTLPQPGAPASSVPDLAAQLAQAYWRSKPESARREAAMADPGSTQAYSSLPRVQLRLSMWVALGDVSQGTGLGVSSLLAAYLVQLLARLLDRDYSPTAAAFLVLRAEQLLSTGGGWQDQVGGLYPGFKLTTSPRGLPLRLDVRPLPLSPALVGDFNAHLLLVHTGMPRLARGLLRTVLDNWARREPHLRALFRRLREGAPEMAEALQRGDWPAVGKMLSEFWSIKKQLATPAPVAPPASGTASNDEAAAVAAAEATLPASSSPPAEPAHVSAFLRATADLCYGASLAGAGGGGFLVLLAPPSNHAAIEAHVRRLNEQRREQLAAANHTFMPYRLFKGAVCHEEGSQLHWSVSASQ